MIAPTLPTGGTERIVCLPKAEGLFQCDFAIPRSNFATADTSHLAPQVSTGRQGKTRGWRFADTALDFCPAPCVDHRADVVGALAPMNGR